MNKKILVTRPFLPPINEYISYLQLIWENNILTNNGPLVQELEEKLEKKLRLKNLVLTSNGTMGIQLAIKALHLKGEIITTPFTFIATASAINWENCSPVFVDIDPETFNIDPSKIEDRISKNTAAILAVHTFSNPCDIEAIDRISKKYNLKIIYDAAHAMFVDYKEKSILEYGDISVVSFHATKLFNTVEGGACVTRNEKLMNRLKSLRNFGFNEQKEIIDFGTNAKMSEMHAAMGLANLKYMDNELNNRKEKYELYLNLLNNNSSIRFQKIRKENYNFSYMPVLFSDEDKLTIALKVLNENNIFPRRYFYPALSSLKLFAKNNENLKITENISKRVLCLPLYGKLKIEEITNICKLINNVI
ncbi:DegT/DnrJ/EryC1/StrS family aminotransferase [Abyssisolibacter fermentans]|uniref:DegT/DnrJ/EryC1/StrS family aminotransferase n=1 Tax=Abyssisolibacter fermentans TaxID=1766203 RepID=UPI00082D32E8|nr:DegT/DnrJ/EryC1/StrS family aminotransferase [Abyssisolibacter fermentans]